MKQKRTARELLAQIENDYFRGAGLAEASMTEGDARRAFRLMQVERLLTTGDKHTPWAMYLSDMFWTADEGRILIHDDHPLMTQEGRQTLTDVEREKLRLIVEIAGLCHDLSLHFAFDLKEALGIRRNDLWVTNRRLVEWLMATENERMAMHTAYTMKKHAIGVYEGMHYLPAQDELAELWSSEYGQLVGRPELTDMPPRDYVKAILDALLQIERHWQRGLKRLKLRPDLIMLHDEIYGVVPRRFDRGVLQAAQALYDYMDAELQGRLVLKEYDYNASSWSEQPESVRRTTAEVLGRFVEKVRDVRSKFLAEGWIADNSLAFNYLMAHAERCGQGWWREEDDAL